MQEFRDKRRKILEKPLFNKKWFRIILDEAHLIKNPDSATYNAVYNLDAVIRWCVTGTPI